MFVFLLNPWWHRQKDKEQCVFVTETHWQAAKTLGHMVERWLVLSPNNKPWVQLMFSCSLHAKPITVNGLQVWMKVWVALWWTGHLSRVDHIVPPMTSGSSSSSLSPPPPSHVPEKGLSGGWWINRCMEDLTALRIELPRRRSHEMKQKGHDPKEGRNQRTELQEDTVQEKIFFVLFSYILVPVFERLEESHPVTKELWLLIQFIWHFVHALYTQQQNVASLFSPCVAQRQWATLHCTQEAGEGWVLPQQTTDLSALANSNPPITSLSL